MSFIDYFGKAAFKTAPDGKKVFFPYGVLGKGRVVDTDETYKRLFTHQKWWSFGGIVMAIVLARFFDWQAAAIFIFLFAIAHHFFTTRITKNLPIATGPFTPQYAKSTTALGLSRRTLWFLAVFVLFMVAVAFFLPAKG